MSDDGTRSELLAALADEFAASLRRGERPTPEDYARRHPEVAQEIEELFPAIALMECVEPAEDVRLAERPGSQIGAYKLLEQIGEGAFGVVFMAEQLQPVRRKVALKVLKPGMDTKQVVARFAAEQQALALMDHPNIAKVLDAGETASGRPYFVMELVRGVAITEYCDANKLSPPVRLAMFVEVCRAVQHAHMKGIIHRDLKPSNIMVTLLDGVPAPKVIDFGVAKAIDAPLTERTLFTHFAQIVGTPLYMSPEQAEMSGLDIDTRSDVYSLGVVLYELLTGSTPFDRERFRTVGIDEVRRIIREEEPLRPSAMISTLAAEAQSTVAERRRSEPRHLVQSLRGDLDWIVTKCLEKDRNRRYAAASDLAADLQRHLDDEPVLARPPSLGYRFRKFAKRNKVGLAIAVALSLLGVLSLAGLVINNRMIARERDQKDEALSRVVEEKRRADQNLSRAREAVKEYLLRSSENPRLQQGDFQDLRKELLETALPFYEEFVRQQHADVELEAERARAYDDLAFLRHQTGDWDAALREQKQAETIFRRLVNEYPDRPELQQQLAEVLNNHGSVLQIVGRLPEAEAAHREALEMTDQLVAAHPQEGSYRDSLARMTGNVGVLLKDTGRFDDAETMLRKAVELREELAAEVPERLELRGQAAQAWTNLGAVLSLQQRNDDAEQAYLRSLELLDPATLESLRSSQALPSQYQQARAQALNNLGVIYDATDRVEEGVKCQRESLAIKELLAKTYPSVPKFRQELARSQSNLGAQLMSLGKFEEAQSAIEASIELYEKLRVDFSDQSEYAVELAGSYTNLARLWGDEGRLEASLPVLAKSIDVLETCRQTNPTLAKIRRSLLIAYWTRAMTLCGLMRYQESLPDWDRTIELDDGYYKNALRLKRASALLNLQRFEQAIADVEVVVASEDASGEDCYLAACAYAAAVDANRDNAALTESYAKRAIALLHEALVRRLEEPNRIATTAELAPLHGRDDFQSIVKQLEVTASDDVLP